MTTIDAIKHVHVKEQTDSKVYNGDRIPYGLYKCDSSKISSTDKSNMKTIQKNENI